MGKLHQHCILILTMVMLAPVALAENAATTAIEAEEAQPAGAVLDVAAAAERHSNPLKEPRDASEADRDATAEGTSEGENAQAGIETIMVTARRREENLQQTPVSITALSGSSLDARGVRDYREVGDFVPNLTLMPSVGGTPGMSATIRGAVSPDAILTDDVAVGIYIDGVYMGKNSGQLLEMLDIERVEVLRGPQGTLYGKNTLGGAVNFVTRKPSGHWGGSARFTGGTHRDFENLLTLDFPLLGEEGLNVADVFGSLAGKATFDFVSRQPFFNNAVSDAPDGFRDLNRVSGSLALRWTDVLLEGLTIDYSFDIHEYDETGPGSQLTLAKTTTDSGFGPRPTLLSLGNCSLEFDLTGACFANPTSKFGTSEQVKPNRADSISNNAPLSSTFSARGHALTVAYPITIGSGAVEMTLKSITGYRTMDLGDDYDFDGTEVAWAQRKVRQKGYKALQEEAQLLGHADLLSMADGDLALDWVVGLFYGSEEGADTQDFLLIPSLVPYCNAAPALCGGATGAFMNFSTTNLSEIDNWSAAPFAQATLAIPTPMGDVSFTPGFRYTWENKQVTRRIATIQVDPTVPSVEMTPRTDFEASFSDPSWNFNLSWQPTDDHMLYATYARGFKSGGFQGRATTARGFLPYDSEKLDSYELGFKTRWFDGLVQLNAAGFFQNNFDRQVQIFDPTTGGVSTITVNAAKTQIWGCEVEAVANLGVFDEMLDGFVLNVGYGLTSPEYTKFVDYDASANGGAGAFVDVSDIRAFFRTPEHDLAVGGAWTLDFDWGRLTSRLDWHWQSEVFFGRSNFKSTQQGSYGLLSGRVELGEIAIASASQLAVGLWGRNLTDEDYRENGSDWGGLGFAQNQYGLGRSYGVDVRFEF